MGKSLILYLVFAIIGAFAYYLLFDNALVIEAITFAVIYFLVSIGLNLALVKIKANKNNNRAPTVSSEKVAAFIEAIGGIENIAQLDSQSSRLKVKLNDLDLLNQERLTALEFGGAYLAGDQLQVTIGADLPDFLQQLQGKIP